MTLTRNPLFGAAPEQGQSAWRARQPADGSFDVAGAAGWMARRAMQVNPEIEPNLRSTVRQVVGPSFSDHELRVLQDRALDAAELQDLMTLEGIKSGSPVSLTRSQKARIDRLVGLLGTDDLGGRARKAYEAALRAGGIRVD